MSDFTLLSAKEYIADLTHSVARAKSRVYILDLVMADDEATRPLTKAIELTAQRHIEINVAIDTFTYGELGGFFSPLKRRSEASKKVTSMVSRFKAAGINFHWLSDRRKLNPFSGITHIKWSVVDNIVYCFGGTNLYKKGIDESIDYMFKIEDEKLAEMIVKEHLAIIRADATRTPYNGFLSATPYGDFLIDSGRRNHSAIYDRACQLAKNADSIIFVSQYCPNGELATHLKSTSSEVYYNRPEIANFLNGLLIRTTILNTGIKTKYKKKTYIHAKFMLFTMKNGEKISLSGSHNFAYSGVRFGTREVALESKDPAVYTQLESFWQKYIK